MKSQYVTLNLENVKKVPVFQRSLHQGSRSVWRKWRQLSQLQRNFVAYLLVILILYCAYTALNYIYLGNRSEGSVNITTAKYSSVFNLLLKVKKEQHADNEKEENIPIIREKPAEKKPHLSVLFPKPKTARQRAVVKAMKHAWKGYKKYGWGHDHLKPLTGTYQDWFHLGLSIVDSLDSLYIMHLYDAFEEARNWVENSFALNNYKDVNLFEVTIRVLGGLLSAYHLTEDVMFLDKAADLGDRLLPCFTKSPTAVPFSDVNLASRLAHAPRWTPDSSTSEVTTLQLEFRDLSRCTGDPKFEKAAFQVSEHVHKLSKSDGLVPIYINPKTGKFNGASQITLGARGDSYYEYLLKQWIQTGQTIDFLKNDYIDAIDGIIKNLVKVTPVRKLVFIGELKAGTRTFSPKMDHLTCYLPGTLALGVYFGMPESHLKFADQVIYTCYRMYADQPTGLAPEIAYFNYEENSGPDMYVHENDAHNQLRPEFVESLWYLYQVTGNKTYQKWGWEVFRAIERYSKVANGYTSIGTVLSKEDTQPRDIMESFFLSETLKYLYLLFDPDRDIINLDKYVLNSEAHLLPIYSN